MAYQQMAFVYDQLMRHAPYDEWAALTEEIFSLSETPIKKVADLGCGTGQITTRLAKAGYDVLGIDYSSDMLSIAQNRAIEAGQTIKWFNQDLRELSGFSDLDAVVSYCDVINYITTVEELQYVFQNVAEMLKPGGLFIFDIHSLYHVKHNFVGQTFAEVDEDVSYIWYCSAADNPGEMYHDVTFFVKEGEKYSRFDESHHQQTHSIEIYQNLLHQAGFEIRNLLGDFSTKQESLHNETERIFFVCEKSSGN